MAFLLLYIIIKAKLVYEVFGMKFVFKKVFNDIKVNLIIAAVILAFVIYRAVKIDEFTTIYNFKKSLLEYIIASEVLVFFMLNYMMIKMKNYKERFTTITWGSICAFISFLFLLIFFSENIDFFSLSLLFYYMVFVWSLYINYCIRMLNSFNVKCGTFVATSIKAMLIATTAWFSVDVKSQTSSVNIIISFISTLYPILDMYTYVRSEIDEFYRQEKDKIVKEKREEFDKQKYEIDKKELQNIGKEIETIKNEINRKTAKIEYKIIHYKNK